MYKSKKFFWATLCVFLLCGILNTIKITTVFAQETITSRLAGSDRYATSLAIAQNGWAHASNVIIATGLNFPDALSASALSKSEDAPIILTKPNSLSQEIITELKSLGTTNALIIGGTGVISTSIETQLKDLGINITRLGGATRYDTSRKIAEKIGVNNGIAVATGQDFPDAISVAPIASIKSMPILLSLKAGLDTNMTTLLKGKNIPVSYIIGGTGVLNASLNNSLPNSKRLSGSTRYGTNLEINTYFQDCLNYDTVYLATGNSFPDALSGSALAAKNNAPIILTDTSISADTLNFMKSKNVKHVVILGGTGVVSQAVENQIYTALAFVKVSSVSLNKATDTLSLGDTDTLTAAVNPGNATNQAVTWTSSDNSVATVDNSGKVTALKVGTTTITVTTADGNITANCSVTVNNIKGIDVSKWQGPSEYQPPIDWALVKSDGVKFAMIRSSYGDGTSAYSNNGIDPVFEANYASAKANGIAVGAYHYSYATTVNQANVEAIFFISRLKGKQFEYPICLDIEDPSQGFLDKATLTNIALTYLNVLKNEGYYPIIYTSKYWFTSVLDDTMLTSYDHWLAQWNTSITYTGTVRIWQYTSSGTVNGITGSVDMDTSYVDYSSKIKSLHLNGF